MILRVTKKMADKIHLESFDQNPTEAVSFLNEWFVNQFRQGRKSYFIFSEAKTLFSIVTSRARIVFEIPGDEAIAVVGQGGEVLDGVFASYSL